MSDLQLPFVRSVCNLLGELSFLNLHSISRRFPGVQALLSTYLTHPFSDKAEHRTTVRRTFDRGPARVRSSSIIDLFYPSAPLAPTAGLAPGPRRSFSSDDGSTFRQPSPQSLQSLRLTTEGEAAEELQPCSPEVSSAAELPALHGRSAPQPSHRVSTTQGTLHAALLCMCASPQMVSAGSKWSFRRQRRWTHHAIQPELRYRSRDLHPSDQDPECVQAIRNAGL